jgi:hypothetical protein
MKSLLRIIFGVLVGIAAFIGIAFVLGLLFRHFHVSFAKADFIGRCLDNAVYIGLGIAMIIVGLYQIRKKVRSGEYDEAKAKSQTKRAWLVGCLIMGIGVFQFLVVSKLSDQAYLWQRVSTTDGYASVEFPLTPAKEDKTYQDGANSIQIITFNCNLHNKDINLRLSYSQIPQKYANSTDNERLDAMKAGFQRGGFTITTFTNENIGAIPVYRIVADENNGNAQSIMRVAIQHNAIYRVVASSTDGSLNDPSIMRFVDSFQIQ